MAIPFLLGAALMTAAAATAASEKTSNEDKECTAAEAAELLGLSEYTVKKKIREEELNGRIVGKKYMVPMASIQEYSKRVGKSGKILGELSLDVEGISNEVWNNPTLLEAFIESTKLQKEIVSIECKKLELTKKRAVKSSDEDQVDDLSMQIMDKEIQGRELAKTIKICETRMLFFKEHGGESSGS